MPDALTDERMAEIDEVLKRRREIPGGHWLTYLAACDLWAEVTRLKLELVAAEEASYENKSDIYDDPRSE